MSVTLFAFLAGTLLLGLTVSAVYADVRRWLRRRRARRVFMRKFDAARARAAAAAREAE